jgi:type IV pilus assembly protein PilY1
MSKMKNNSFISRFRVLNAAAALVVMMTVEALAATTPLSDQPILVANVPANVMLALSVEFPTAITRAHQGDTFNTSGDIKYLGYFDPEKCYDYHADGYFTPSGSTTSKSSGYACSGKWSGNFMNWATMQGIDTFRWVLTGGNRVIDEPLAFAGASGSPLGRTVLQRATPRARVIISGATSLIARSAARR